MRGRGELWAAIMLVMLTPAAWRETRRYQPRFLLDIATAPDDCGDGRAFVARAVGNGMVRLNACALGTGSSLVAWRADQLRLPPNGCDRPNELGPGKSRRARPRIEDLLPRSVLRAVRLAALVQGWAERRTPMTKSLVVAAAELAMERAARTTGGQMRRGLATMATVISVAPWIGVLGTLDGILGAFHGISGPRQSIMAHYFEHFFYALTPAAFGLFISTVAQVPYHHLVSRAVAIEDQMRSAADDIAHTFKLSR